jgi:hypothetical protein
MTSQNRPTRRYQTGRDQIGIGGRLRWNPHIDVALAALTADDERREVPDELRDALVRDLLALPAQEAST